LYIAHTFKDSVFTASHVQTRFVIIAKRHIHKNNIARNSNVLPRRHTHNIRITRVAGIQYVTLPNRPNIILLNIKSSYSNVFVESAVSGTYCKVVSVTRVI